MTNDIARRDQNRVTSLLAESSAADKDTVKLYADPATHRLLVDSSFTPSGTQDTNLTKVGGTAIALGQTTLSASIPVAIASNQSAIPASQSGTWNITNISGTVSLPTGAATAANQTSGSQLTQIVDAGGEAVTVTGGKLDVNATVTGGTGSSAVDDAAFTAATDSGTPIMGFVTADAVDSGDVGVLAMDTARNLKVIAQSNSGVDIGDVTINNASGGSAVNIQDGGNTITVDGSGTAGTAASGVVTIQGVASMTPVQVSQATAANLNVTEASAASALTSLQLIDDVVYVDDTSTHSTGSSKGVGIMAAATPTDTSVNANDIGMVAMTTDRRLLVDASGVAVPVTDNSASLSVDWNGTQPVTGSGTATGALRVELPTNGTGTVGLNAGTNAIGKLAANSGVDIGDVDVTSIIPGTGATNLGKVEDAGHTTGDVGVMALGVRQDAQAALATTTADYIPFATDSIGSQYTTNSASTGAIGATIYYNSALLATKQAVNASAGNMYGYHIYNPNSAVMYVQIWNIASASVTVGTTAPTMVLAVPPLGWVDATGMATPIDFKTALTIAATTTASGSSAPGTGLVTNIWYK